MLAEVLIFQARNCESSIVTIPKSIAPLPLVIVDLDIEIAVVVTRLLAGHDPMPKLPDALVFGTLLSTVSVCQSRLLGVGPQRANWDMMEISPSFN